MDFVVLTFQTTPVIQEILEAELGELGYHAFWETPEGLRTAIDAPLYDESAISSLVEQYASMGAISFTKKTEAKQNWNAQWEASFEPITVGNQVRVRAHFHEPDPSFEHEVIITPKMSFGTGHHETTRLMMKQQLELGNRFKTILDLGTGTGILAILAKKLGAETIWGYDSEDWAVENAIENAALNDTSFEVRLGTVAEAEQLDMTFDLILANINRGVLEREMAQYVQLLNPNGILLLSGFYERDIPKILDKAEGLKLKAQDQENHWVVLRMGK
ncbi:MAG: 50S ribosomal protein L11 methyltransferase [Bacteroidota bacterium]